MPLACLGLLVRLIFATVLLVPVARAAGQSVGGPAPAWTFDGIVRGPEDGAGLSLESLRGRVVVLEFWASWCGPCVAHIPHLNRLVSAFEGEAVAFVSVTPEERESVEQFLSKRDLRSWVACDPDKSMLKAYGVSSLPRTFVIDGDGRVALDGSLSEIDEGTIRDVMAGREARLARAPAYIGAPPGLWAADESEPALRVELRWASERADSYEWSDGRMTAVGAKLGRVLGDCLDMRVYALDIAEGLEELRVDASICFPTSTSLASRRSILVPAIGEAFGLEARIETRRRPVIVVRQRVDAHHTLRLAREYDESKPSSVGRGDGVFIHENQPLFLFFMNMGDVLKTPMLDETGLDSELFTDITLSWAGEGLAPIARAIEEVTGLEARVEERAIDHLVLRRAGAGAQE